MNGLFPVRKGFWPTIFPNEKGFLTGKFIRISGHDLEINIWDEIAFMQIILHFKCIYDLRGLS